MKTVATNSMDTISDQHIIEGQYGERATLGYLEIYTYSLEQDTHFRLRQALQLS